MLTYRPARMRFGAFLAPFHGLGDNPTLALERDMQLVEILEDLDYDEAWIGEHHSGGAEIIGSPELFIAGAAARTKRIMLGTGVVSLGYHNPMILADRMVQLDHQTRGRVMFGVGPGQLPADAFMMGIHPKDQRTMMNQSLEAMIELFAGRTVTMDAGWFKLVDARLQILPYQAPRMEMAIACTFTPNGPVVAGKHGLSMLSVAASTGMGAAALPDHWRICAEVAAENGQTVHRDNWRVVVPIHIAPTREQAWKEVAEGIIPNVINYLRGIGGAPMREALAGVVTGDDAVKLWTTEGINPFGVLTLGTPDDIAARIEGLLDQSGGFGRFLCLAHNAANWTATKLSYESLARHVMPRFQHSDRRAQSAEYTTVKADEFIQPMVEAMGQSFVEHASRMKTEAEWPPKA